MVRPPIPQLDMIPFNRPHSTGRELDFIATALKGQHLSGDGPFTKRVQQWFNKHYHFDFSLLTTSGTDALEMSAILANIGPGDEVILPSYTFVSTANAFVLRGAKPVFVDSQHDHPNIDPRSIEQAIGPRTKAIVVVHYGGIACNMKVIRALADKYALWLIEDAAQAIDAYHEGKPLGSFGHMSCFSFHETKNIQCGEGGLLVVNDPDLTKRAEIIREKGTNRSSFFRGEVDKYGWIDVGSSFLAPELSAAYLLAQLEGMATIQAKRIQIWERYADRLAPLVRKGFRLPEVPGNCTNNAHLFSLICPSLEVRTALIAHLRAEGIQAVFHYQPLHASLYNKKLNPAQCELPNATRFGDRLVRLPLFPDLTENQVGRVIQEVLRFTGQLDDHPNDE